MMKRILILALAVVAASQSAYAVQDPDAPGSRMITVQAGGFPGIGGLITGQIVMANVWKGHLYGGLQLGGNYRHGKALDAKMVDLSLSPRILYGFNVGRALELHAGGFAGVDARRLDTRKSQLLFCYGGFGGLRWKLGESLGVILEGGYSNCLPYATAGLAFRF